MEWERKIDEKRGGNSYVRLIFSVGTEIDRFYLFVSVFIFFLIYNNLTLASVSRQGRQKRKEETNVKIVMRSVTKCNNNR